MGQMVSPILFCAFADLGFVWVLCGFCSEAWIDVGGVGGGVDLVVPWVKGFADLMGWMWQ